MTKSLIDHEALKRIHRDLDACQKVIHLAGGFDPAYCKDAQARLKEIDALLAAPAAPVRAEQEPGGHELDGLAGDLLVAADLVRNKAVSSRLVEYSRHVAKVAYCTPTHPDALSQAATDVLAERRRQVEAEGWTTERDDGYQGGQLASAAACYAMNAGVPMRNLCPPYWPRERDWWKPTNSRRDLVKAGALILAEIERLDRVALAAKDGDQ